MYLEQDINKFIQNLSISDQVTYNQFNSLLQKKYKNTHFILQCSSSIPVTQHAQSQADQIVVGAGQVHADAVSGHHQQLRLLVEELCEAQVADALLDERAAGDQLQALHLAEVGLLARHVVQRLQQNRWYISCYQNNQSQQNQRYDYNILQENLLSYSITKQKYCAHVKIIISFDLSTQKKTANNIYLILQYCNEGDLGAYLKIKKKILQDQAVEYFVQILHAFSTLVKNKIMHRDFKLPNVLKHEGVIKLADFGFAKLLGTEDQQVQTILGSPLNMAPQVLDKQAYNSKADIWSIGVSFYQMIFGKVPFSAGNIIDLLKRIRKQPLTFPHKIPSVIQDVIKKMLVVDPIKRIQWSDLFNHPITTYLQDKLGQNLRQSIHCDKQDFKFNLSKFYIKTNMVIETPYQINAKQQLNAHIKQMMKQQSPSKFTGHLIKRKMERKPLMFMLSLGTQKQIKQEEGEGDSQIIQKKQLSTQQICQQNWKILLHHRNLYAFLGHLAEEALEYNFNIYGQCLAFLILKKAMTLIANLKKDLQTKSLQGIKKWEIYQKTQEHKKVVQLLNQQQQIFNQLYQKLALKVLQKGTLAQFQQDLMISGKFTIQQTQRQTLIRVILQYFNRSISKKVQTVTMWKHFSKIIDSLDLFNNFPQGFDFSAYYDAFNETEDEVVVKICKQKYNEFIKNYGKIK